MVVKVINSLSIVSTEYIHPVAYASAVHFFTIIDRKGLSSSTSLLARTIFCVYLDIWNSRPVRFIAPAAILTTAKLLRSKSVTIDDYIRSSVKN